MIARAVLLTALVVCTACSQPPTPSGRKSDSPQPNEQPQTNQGQPNTLIGTETAPAVVRIAKSKEEAAQEETDRQRETTTQWWIIGLTGVIALFTGGFIFVGWKQRQTYEATLTANKVIERK